MFDAPSSPPAATRAPAGMSKPPPLTPYRGHPPPPSVAGNSMLVSTAGARAAAASAAAYAAVAAVAVGGSTAGGGHRIPPPPLWEQAMEQEKRLRSELRKKSFWDHDVRRLRAALQATYEALLFGHYEFAAAAEAEPCLWKSVFYKPIEEFRSRIRALESLVKGGGGGGAAAAGANGAGVAAANGGGGAAGTAPVPALASPDEARAQLGRTTGAYLRFLDEALAFYRKMVWKLQWVYGSVGAVVDIDAALQNEIAETVPRAGGGGGPGGAGGSGGGGRVPDARASVHRCLIYLGDLCRYQSMALKERPSSSRPLWERAMSYYRQAARVLPASGNPYNQMAVMSYYTSDELRAVYYYFRSLAAEMPFVTARENLLLLFEKNRSRYGNIASLHAAAALQGGRDADARSASGHAADVVVRFVRLHGLLFDRINLDSLPEVLAAAIRDLNTFLGHAGCRALLQKAPEADQMLFHLAVMSVFSVHNVSSAAPAPGGGGPSAAALAAANGGGYAATAQRSMLRNHALTVAMRFAAAVATCTAGMAEAAAAAGGVGDVDPGFGAAATACHVMLAWMVANPSVLAREREAAVATTAGGGSPDAAAEVSARAAFLTSSAQLASRLADLSRRRAQDQDWQDPGLRHRSLPEDAELVGFGPLAPVVGTAAGWPAAAEAPGGAAVMAVRVARMLQMLRHLDDALGQPQGSQASTAAASSSRELAVAIRAFKAAVEAAMRGNPLPHAPVVPVALPSVTTGAPAPAPAAVAAAASAAPPMAHAQQQTALAVGPPSRNGALPHAQAQPAQPSKQRMSAQRGNGPGSAVQAQQQPQQSLGDVTWLSELAALAAGAPLQQSRSAPAAAAAAKEGATANGSGAAAGKPNAAAAAAASPTAAGAEDEAADDEIVYQPPRQNSGIPRLGSVTNFHQRSNSCGGNTAGTGTEGAQGHPHVMSQEGRGLLSKQPSAGASSTAHSSRHHSREVSRDGSTLMLPRSPPALNSGGGGVEPQAVGVAAAVAALMGACPTVPPNLTVAVHGGIGGGGSGLTSPGSAYGGAALPSPRTLGLDHGGVGGGGGTSSGGGSRGSKTGMVGAGAHVPARPPSPAAGDLPGAGQIGLLQHLLHGGPGGAVAGHGTTGHGGSAGASALHALGSGAGTHGQHGMRRASIGATAATTAAPGLLAGNVGASGFAGGVGGVTRRASAAHLAPHAAAAAPPATRSTPAPVSLLPLTGHQGPLAAAAAAAPPQPQPQGMADAPSAPFAGLPVSVQQRAQQAVHSQPPQPQPPQWHTHLQSLLRGTSGLEDLAANAGGSGDATFGQGQGRYLAPPAQPQLQFGGMGNGAGSTLFGLSNPLPSPHFVGLVPAATGPGTAAGAFGVGAGAYTPQLAWPAGGGATSAFGAGGVGGGIGGAADDFNMALFAAATGNYEAAALAEATAEATAVAAADEVLQRMDED